jgi:hypothetical protein
MHTVKPSLPPVDARRLSIACSARFPGGLTGAAWRSAATRFRLVIRVLRHKLAGEGMAQDRLPQRLGAFQLGVEIDFEVVGDGELVFDGFLFGGRREREWQFLVAYQIRKIAG